jgi:hypothetical protein
MTPFKWLASFALAAILVPTLQAEQRCPGNIASIRFRLIHGFQIIVTVRINHTGPYNFMVDTGTQFTTINPSLAAELHLRIRDSIEVVGVGFRRKASLGQLALLEAGSHAITNLPVEVQDLERLGATDRHIRGILGANFLGHFDVLIDNARSMLCLDDANVMRAGVKGEHIALVTVPQTTDDVPLTALPIIPVHLFGVGVPQLLLVLDSGTNAPFLYNPAKYWPSGLSDGTPALGHDGDGVERAFSILPPRNIEIGSVNLQHVSFVAPVGSAGNAPTLKVDGLLATAIFRRIFIGYTGHFVVLEPW